jgi:hypothetical protein
MMNPVGPQVKHILTTRPTRGTPAGWPTVASDYAVLVVRLSTSQLLPTFAIVTVTWFL